MGDMSDPTYGLGLSPESTIIVGYGNRQRTLVDAETQWHYRRLHPELKRRTLALYFSHPGTRRAGVDSQGRPILHSPMGLGGGARNPARQEAEFLRRHTRVPTGRSSRTYKGVRYWLKPGMAPYAPPGSSNHEDGTLEGFAAAVDTVGWQDGWQVANAHRFGLRHFKNVNGEPWHLQLAEYPNSKRGLTAAYRAGTRHKLFPLPVFGEVTGPNGETCDCDAVKPVETQPGPKPVLPPFNPAKGQFGLWPLNSEKPTLSRKRNKNATHEMKEATRFLQGVLRKSGLTIKIDGDFGRKTERAVKMLQGWNQLKKDGWVGPKTWAVVDKVAVR